MANIVKRTLLILMIPIVWMCCFHVIHTEARSVAQPPIIVDGSSGKIILDKDMDILVDKNHEYTIEDIASGDYDKEFSKFTGIGRPNMGYTTSDYWIAINLDNQTLKRDWLLEVGSPKINRIILYTENELGGFDEMVTGNSIPFRERAILNRNLVYQLPLELEETNTFYLQVTTGSSMQLPLTIWDPFAFDEKTNIEYLLFGILFGISFVMALYNFFLYFSVRSRSYLYYTLFVVLNALLYLSEMGLGFQFLWPSSVEWNLRAVVIFMCLNSVGALLFTRSFFEIKNYMPRLNKVFIGLILVSVLPPLWIIFSYTWAVEAALLCVLSTIVMVMITLVISVKRRYRPARYFAFAWGLFLIGVTISLLVDVGLFPLTFLTKYAWQFSTAGVILLLSFALGDKIKLIREEKVEAERKAKESQREAIMNLHRSDKLKDEFLAMTSHELRTPLNGIIGIAETLQEGAAGELSVEVKNHLEMIIMSGRRLANLVDDILDYSKLNNNELDIHLEPVHIYEITNVVMTICQPLVKDKPIRLINKISEDTPIVSADKNRLQQIMYNLIGNAIKYTERGKVVVSAIQFDEYIDIKVTDTGIGIASDHLSEIFEPFYQESHQLVRENVGAGIGLNITKRLVELQQGDMYVTSTLGIGSEFGFTLPISHEEQAFNDETAMTITPFTVNHVSAQAVTKTTPPSVKKEATILIADDEPVNLQVLQNHLTMRGYDVDAVSKGEEVLEKVKHHKYDLLILDVMMPKMSGYEVCQRVREHFSLTELPILMLTAKSQTNDMVTAFKVGANDYLTKPCDKSELFQRTQTLIQLGRLNSEHINMNQSLERKVTDRTKALQHVNEELEKVNNELIQIEESRQQLLANIAHELGTPVTLIHGYVQAIQKGLIEANQTRYLEMVHNKISVLNRLIRDLTDLSKLEAGQISLDIEQVALDQWISQVVDKIELDVVQGERGFIKPALNSLSVCKGYFCKVDINRMDQVFSNLIRNAIKFTRVEDGEISISVRLTESDNKVIIDIHDNGIGIELERVPHIFERYYKISSSIGNSEGTGLGLAIVKEIINLHHAQIWLESEVGEGSVFSIALPIELKE